MTEFLEVHVVIQEPSEALRTRRAILRLDLVRSASMIYGANDMYAIDYGDAIRTELLTISWPTFDKLREVLIGRQEPDAPFGDTPMPDVSDMLKPGFVQCMASTNGPYSTLTLCVFDRCHMGPHSWQREGR